MSETRSAEGPRVQTVLDSLRQLVADPDKERIFVADLLMLVPDRALLGLILLFSVPNMIPMPPGTSAVLGAPLVILALQWMLGLRAWLPSGIARRSMARSQVQQLVGRLEPWLVRGDDFLRPRLALVLQPLGERLASVLCVVLALIMVLPIPLGNMAPAFAVTLLALGFLRGDGLWVLAGLIVAVASIAVACEVVWALTMVLGGR